MALYIVLMTALFIAVFGGLASRFQKKMISEAELPIYKPNKEEFPEMLGLSSQLEADLYADPSRELVRGLQNGTITKAPFYRIDVPWNEADEHEADEHKLGLSKPKKNKSKLLTKKKTKPKKKKTGKK